MHIPVLQKEVLKYLAPKVNQNFIDCTIGEGGHTLAILEKILPDGKILGIDCASELILKLKPQIIKFKKNFFLVCDNFTNLKKIVKKYNFKRVSGILFDLGISSWHLEKSGRGFSFLRNESLDMRYHIEHFRRPSKLHDSLTTEKIMRDSSVQEIEKILREYGEERFARRIAREIIESRKIRPIKTTFQLVKIIKKAVPRWYERGRIHPATRTFQALRIAVNDELKNLEKTLPQALEILEPQGRLIVISFHSLEDRIVKIFLKNQAQKNLLKVLTKKPVRPTIIEVEFNPRSRSAKLRAAIKT